MRKRIHRRCPPRAARCVLIWLDGGPSHLDTLDPKPLAPAEVRGPFSTIATKLSGVRICELMPRLAQRLDRAAIIRSMTSPLGEHNFGVHYLLTGYPPTPAVEYPSWGAVASAVANSRRALPYHIAIPNYRVGGGRFTGNGYLPPRHQPFSVGADPAKPGFEVRDLNLYPEIDVARLQRRRRYLQALAQSHIESAETTNPQQDPWRQAYDLVASDAARQAFDLEQESRTVRDQYGGRTIGQSCLLARRLLERDVPFLTINYQGWDTHDNAYTRLKEGFSGACTPVGLIPSLDQAPAR